MKFPSDNVLGRSAIPMAMVLFLLSFVLRYSLISKGMYHLDTLNLVQKTDVFLQTGDFQGQFGPGYPLMMVLCIVFTVILQMLGHADTVFAVNMVSVLFSAASVPLLYLIGRKIYDAPAATMASLLFSVSPIYLGVSVYGKSHAPTVFFLLLAVLFLIRYLSGERRSDLIWGSVALGLMGSSRVQDLILMAIPIACFFSVSLLVKRRPIGKILSRLSLASLIVVMIVVVFHIPYILSGLDSQYSSDMSDFWASGLTRNFKGLVSASLMRTLYFFEINMERIGMIAALFGLGYLIRARRFLWLGFMVLWILVPVLFYGNLHTTAPRFFTLILPPIYLCQGYFFAQLMRCNRIFTVIGLAVFVVAFTLPLSTISRNLIIRHQHDHIGNYAQWVVDRTEPDAAVIMCDEKYFVSHLASREMVGRPLQFDHVDDRALYEFKQRLDQILAEGRPVYITSTGLYFYDPDSAFSNFVKRHYRLTDLGWRWYEDWHRGEIFQDVIRSHLYRLELR